MTLVPAPIPKVVIIGAGFGGLAAAKRLANRPVDVTLVDRRNHHLFQPLLYQVATAGLSPADIAAPIRSILAGARNIRILLDEVTGIDRDRGVVSLELGALAVFLCGPSGRSITGTALPVDGGWTAH